MAYNWLMMTSSGDNNRLSGSLGLLTDNTTKKINKNKPKAEQETAQPTAARFNNNFDFFLLTICRQDQGYKACWGRNVLLLVACLWQIV